MRTFSISTGTFPSAMGMEITRLEVEAAQTAWGDALVEIGAAYSAGQAYRELAERRIKALYAYGISPVLFKPTIACEIQFRTTFEEALSYFIAGQVHEDVGFALRPWVSVEFENADMFLTDGYAVTMGNYFFTAADGDRIKVEFTKGYLRDSEGNLRINLQHSSLPFEPMVG